MKIKALFQINVKILTKKCRQYKEGEKKAEEKEKEVKIDISENKSSDQRDNNDELTDTEIYSIVDNIWDIKITPTDHDNSP